MPGFVPRGVNEHGASSKSIQKKKEGRASAWKRGVQDSLRIRTPGR